MLIELYVQGSADAPTAPVPSRSGVAPRGDLLREALEIGDAVGRGMVKTRRVDARVPMGDDVAEICYAAHSLRSSASEVRGLGEFFTPRDKTYVSFKAP